MAILNCLYLQHNLWLVLLAAALCIVGSIATVRLWQRSLDTAGWQRFDWLFLAAVTAGASIWATHFVAMLGYRSPIQPTFDAQLTIASIVIAIIGTFVGFGLTSFGNSVPARISGGAIVGLSIAAMHFVGMFAYRVDGIVEWNSVYIVTAILCAVAFSISAMWILTNGYGGERSQTMAAAALVLAIVTLHFTGMTAFTVVPMPGYLGGANSDGFYAMAMAVALVALIIVFTGVSSQMIDDRNKRKSRDDLLYIATHDELTGLENRRAFNEALAYQCAKLTDTSHNFTVLMIDLDRFKPVNDTLGHSTGDQVLRRVATRLKKIIRSDDKLVRLGGDEFAIIAFDASNDSATIERICERIVEVISRPFILDGHVVELGASLGVAMAPHDGKTPDELSQNADIALYAAKEGGRSRYQVYEAGMSAAVQLRRSLERDLRRAVSREEFEVYYQPQIDSRTGRYFGAEALVRWNHPERGVLTPDVFIPLAEELGLITAIGSWVLKTACRAATEWPEELSVAVNLSPVQVMDRRLPRVVRKTLLETGLKASRLELEITETAFIGNDVQALAVLNELRSLGVMISLDDFGTGYSSLSYLHRFPIDRIKIDRSFIDRAPYDADSVSIIQAITRLGSSLGIAITAEGIETEDQKCFSRDEGCHNLQGYLISRPIRIADLLKMFSGPARSKDAA